MLYLPEEKRKAIIRDCKNVLSQEAVSVRALARVIGRMTAASQAIATAPLHYRKLQNAKKKQSIQPHSVIQVGRRAKNGS